MPIYDLFSNRHRPRPEGLTYDDLPTALRMHCLRIINEAIGGHDDLRREMCAVLETEHPTPTFGADRKRRISDPWRDRVTWFFEDCITRGDFYEAMDAIEAALHFINKEMRRLWDLDRFLFEASQKPDEAIQELNARFEQAGIGYQFSKEQGRMVRMDSGYVHRQVAEPAMMLLTEKGFEGAAQEFAQAHQFYRESVRDPERGKDALGWAVKAVESTAKAIMDARGWKYEKADTVVPLLDKLFKNGLVPEYLQSAFGGLRTALTSGLPTIANRDARHGQGATPRPIEQHLVTLAMNLAAATIRFLVEAHKAQSQTPEPP